MERRVSGHSRGGVFSVASPWRDVRLGAGSEAEGELIRNRGCFGFVGSWHDLPGSPGSMCKRIQCVFCIVLCILPLAVCLAVCLVAYRER